MFRNPTTDLIVVLVIVLLIFGPKRLPGLGKQLGQGLREFKDSIAGEHPDDDEQGARPALARAPERVEDPGVAASAGEAPEPAPPAAGSPGAGPADARSRQRPS